MAETRSDPTVRAERFLRYIEGILPALSCDARGRVTEVIDRALLDTVSTISRDHHNLQREAVLLGVETLMRMPELLVELLASVPGYERHRVLVVAVEPTDDERVRGLVRDAVVRTEEPDPGAVAAEAP